VETSRATVFIIVATAVLHAVVNCYSWRYGLIGSDHKWVFPISALAGDLLILTADTLGRILVALLEILASTIKSIIGGPFLIFIIRKDK